LIFSVKKAVHYVSGLFCLRDVWAVIFATLRGLSKEQNMKESSGL